MEKELPIYYCVPIHPKAFWTIYYENISWIDNPTYKTLEDELRKLNHVRDANVKKLMEENFDISYWPITAGLKIEIKYKDGTTNKVYITATRVYLKRPDRRILEKMLKILIEKYKIRILEELPMVIPK